MDNKIPHILIVDDDPNLLETLHDILKLKGFEPAIASTGRAAMKQLETHSFDLALLDLRLEDMSGLKVLEAVKARSPETECILLTGHASQDTAIEAIRMGAYGYFQKPFEMEQVLLSIQRALEKSAAGKALIESERFAHATVDALSSHLAILDETGIIIAVNRAWREFAKANSTGDDHLKLCEGVNYLTVCDTSKGKDSEEVTAMAAGIRAVMSGGQKEFSFEYPCHSPEEKRWFTARVTRFPGKGPLRIVVAHENITERKLAEEKIAQTEKRYRSLIENAPDGVVLIGLDGKYKYASPAALKIFDYKPEDVIGANPNEQTHPDDLSMVLGVLQDIIENPSNVPTIQYRFLHKNGSWRWVESTFTNLLAEPSVEAIVINFRDINESMQAQQALNESRLLFQTLIESLPQNIYAKDVDGRFIFANQHYCATQDKPLEEIVGKTDFELHPREMAEKYLLDDRRVIEAGETLELEEEHQPIGKKKFFVQVIKTPFSYSKGQPSGILGIFWDITERKRAEEAVRESQQRFSQVWEATSDAMVLSDPDGIVLAANPAYLDLYGYKLEQVVGTSFAIIFPEEIQAQAVEQYKTVFASEVIPPTFESTIRRADGSERTVESNVTFLTRTEQRIAMLSTIRDITERKKAEEALRKSESLFSSLFHANPTRISITRFEDSRFLDVNETFLNSVGYTREEVVGHTSSEINDWADPRERIRLRNLLEKQGRVKDFETQLRRKSGETMDVLISAELIELFGETCILSVGLDITERKHAEIEIKHRTEELELINALNEAANSGENLDTIIEVFTRELRKISVCKDATLYLLNPDGKDLVMQHLGLPPSLVKKIEQLIGGPLPQVQIPIKEGGYFHQALQTDSGLITTDPRIIQSWMQEFTETKFLPVAIRGAVRKLIPQIYRLLDIRSTLIVPLISNKKAIGLLDISSAEILTEKDLNRIQKISSQLTAVILREKANEALLESEKRYRTIFDGVQDAIFIETKDGRILEVNKSACEMYGYERDEFLKKTVADFVLEGSFVFAPHLLAPNNQFAPVETINRRANGEPFPIEISGGVQVINGEEVNMAIVRDITQRKKDEEALRESEQKYRTLFDEMLSGVAVHEILCDEKGRPVNYRFLSINAAFEKMTGLPAAGVIGKTVLEVMPATELRWIEVYGQVALTRTPIQFENYSSELGKYFEVRAFSPEQGKFATIFNDITESKKAEKNIHQRVKELELLYESGLVFGQLLNPREIAKKIIELLGEKLDWHHTAIRLVRGQGELELVAFDQPGLENQAEAQVVEAHFNKVVSRIDKGLSGWAIQQSKTVRLGDVRSDPHYVESSPGIHSGLYVPLKSGDRGLGVISIESEEPDAFSEADEQLLTTLANQAANAFENARLYQKTNRYAQELELRVQERTADLSRVNADLAQAARVKDEFLASMSHELRTPLTGILGLSEVLQLKVYGELNDKQRNTLKTIEESGRHLLDLINDILDLSKIEAGKLELQFAPCSLADICQASLQLTKGMAQHKNQRVHYSPPSSPIIVNADARRLKQLLVNLLSNAIKFTPENGELGLEIQAIESERNIKMTVWDKGIGINPNDLQKIFKPFVQLDSGLAREYSGTGLGLSLVHHLVEMHNGGIKVESKLGEGSRFTIILPWSPQNTTPIPYTPQRGNTGGLSNILMPNELSKAPLVMIVDDNETILRMIADFLEARQYRVMKARSGTELLELVGEYHPNIMLVDIQMPGIGGLETIRRIRSHPDPLIARVPVIAVTALAMPADREHCLRAGADDYMSKPLKLKALAAAIQTLLEKNNE